MSLTPEQEERLREVYRKNSLALILLSPDVIAEEFPDLPDASEQPNRDARALPPLPPP